MSGVYQIYNPINNKRYIGSSINVERRLKEHLRNLKKNTHCNIYLQSAYNKYKEVLQFQFLEEKEYESKTKKQEELIMACGSKKGGSKKGGKTGKTGK